MSDESYPVEFERVLSALNDTGVRYLVVGGVAVVLHGVDRLTADLDIVVDLEPKACHIVMQKLTEVGYRPRPPVRATDFANADKRRDWIENKGMQVFSLWDPSNELPVLDVFVDYPLDFDEMISEGVVMDLSTVKTTVASIKHLIAMKTDTGRDKDQQDVQALRERK